MESAARAFAAEVTKTNADWMIFWAAGRGSIGSSEQEMKAETALLESALSAIGSETGLKQHSGKFFFASSAGGIYAASSDEIITESSKPMPTSAYGKEKLVQEALVSDWGKTMPNTSALLGRISNLYGPNQSKAKQQGLISHIARCVLLHQTVNVYVPLDTIRDYLHVRDAAQLILASMQLMHIGSIATKIIAAEEPTTIAQIVGIFRHITQNQFIG
jgi:UDP-glucose 4-epimerase